MILQNIFLIQFLMVAGIDYLGFVDEGLSPLVKKLTGSKVGKLGKPFNCSTCATFWLGLIYLLFAGAFTMPNIALCILAALLTPITYDLINLVKDLLTSGITFIYRLFNI